MIVNMPTGTEVYRMLKKLGLPVAVNRARGSDLYADAAMCTKLDMAYQEFEQGEHPPETDFLKKVKAWMKKRPG